MTSQQSFLRKLSILNLHQTGQQIKTIIQNTTNQLIMKYQHKSYGLVGGFNQILEEHLYIQQIFHKDLNNQLEKLNLYEQKIQEILEQRGDIRYIMTENDSSMQLKNVVNAIFKSTSKIIKFLEGCLRDHLLDKIKHKNQLQLMVKKVGLSCSKCDHFREYEHIQSIHNELRYGYRFQPDIQPQINVNNFQSENYLPPEYSEASLVDDKLTKLQIGVYQRFYSIQNCIEELVNMNESIRLNINNEWCQNGSRKLGFPKEGSLSFKNYELHIINHYQPILSKIGKKLNELIQKFNESKKKASEKQDVGTQTKDMGSAILMMKEYEKEKHKIILECKQAIGIKDKQINHLKTALEEQIFKYQDLKNLTINLKNQKQNQQLMMKTITFERQKLKQQTKNQEKEIQNLHLFTAKMQNFDSQDILRKRKRNNSTYIQPQGSIGYLCKYSQGNSHKYQQEKQRLSHFTKTLQNQMRKSKIQQQNFLNYHTLDNLTNIVSNKFEQSKLNHKNYQYCQDEQNLKNTNNLRSTKFIESVMNRVKNSQSRKIISPQIQNNDVKRYFKQKKPSICLGKDQEKNQEKNQGKDLGKDLGKDQGKDQGKDLGIQVEIQLISQVLFKQSEQIIQKAYEELKKQFITPKSYQQFRRSFGINKLQPFLNEQKIVQNREMKKKFAFLETSREINNQTSHVIFNEIKNSKIKKPYLTQTNSPMTRTPIHELNFEREGSNFPKKQIKKCKENSQKVKQFCIPSKKTIKKIKLTQLHHHNRNPSCQLNEQIVFKNKNKTQILPDVNRSNKVKLSEGHTHQLIKFQKQDLIDIFFTPDEAYCYEKQKPQSIRNSIRHSFGSQSQKNSITKSQTKIFNLLMALIAEVHSKNKSSYHLLKNFIMCPFESIINENPFPKIINSQELSLQLNNCVKFIIMMHRRCHNKHSSIEIEKQFTIENTSKQQKLQKCTWMCDHIKSLIKKIFTLADDSSIK